MYQPFVDLAVIPVCLPSSALNILLGLLTLLLGNGVNLFVELSICPVARRCCCKRLFVMKRSPQRQLYGLSPVCRRTCKVKSFD